MLPFQQQTATAFHAELAEGRGGAENGSPGRAASSGAPFLSTHDSKRVVSTGRCNRFTSSSENLYASRTTMAVDARRAECAVGALESGGHV
jgi:hypothetical protein